MRQRRLEVAAEAVQLVEHEVDVGGMHARLPRQRQRQRQRQMAASAARVCARGFISLFGRGSPRVQQSPGGGWWRGVVGVGLKGHQGCCGGGTRTWMRTARMKCGRPKSGSGEKLTSSRPARCPRVQSACPTPHRPIAAPLRVSARARCCAAGAEGTRAQRLRIYVCACSSVLRRCHSCVLCLHFGLRFFVAGGPGVGV